MVVGLKMFIFGLVLSLESISERRRREADDFWFHRNVSDGEDTGTQ